MSALSDAYAARVAADISTQSVATWVRSYTRGNGFDQVGPDDEPDWPREQLQAVILAAADRLATSGGSIARQGVDGAEVAYFRFDGFNLVEQCVLHDFRRRAA